MIFTHFKRILDYLGILLFMISMGIFIVLWTALLLSGCILVAFYVLVTGALKQLTIH